MKVNEFNRIQSIGNLDLTYEEQLQEIVTLVDILTQDQELTVEEGHNHRRVVYHISDRLDLEIFRPEDAESDYEAGLYYNWKAPGDEVFSQSIRIAYENGALKALEDWEWPGDEKEAVRLAYQMGIGIGGTFQRYIVKQKVISSSCSGISPEVDPQDLDFHVELLQIIVNTEKYGLKPGQICVWQDPETGEQSYVAINIGESLGGFGYSEGYVDIRMISPVQPGENWQDKKTHWHDLPMADLEGKQWVIHNNLECDARKEEIVEVVGRLDYPCEGCHFDAAPFVRYEDIPEDVKEEYYHSGSKHYEGSLDNEHYRKIARLLGRIAKRHELELE